MIALQLILWGYEPNYILEIHKYMTLEILNTLSTEEYRKRILVFLKQQSDSRQAKSLPSCCRRLLCMPCQKALHARPHFSPSDSSFQHGFRQIG